MCGGGEDLNKEAKRISELEIGEHDNAYHFPQLTDRVIRDMRSFLLWSCILRDRIRYGKIPVSSAPIESQIKNIKQDLFKNKASPMIPDDFIDMLLSYVVGRSNIIEAKDMEIENMEKSDDNANDSIINDSKSESTSDSCHNEYSTIYSDICKEDFAHVHTKEALNSSALCNFSNTESSLNTIKMNAPLSLT